jgi:hypothetical protein
MPASAIDLPVLDREVGRAAGRVEQLGTWLTLGSAEARKKARNYDVWDRVRHTAVMATYRALAELEPSLLDVPLRDGLMRWSHELLQARIGQDLALDDADAAHAIDPRLPPSRIAALEKAAAARNAIAAGTSEVPEEIEPDKAILTYADAFAKIVTAPDTGHAARAMERAGELAAPVAAIRKEARERRFEAARRLGLAHPWSLATKSDVGAAARSLLDATEPFAAELFKIARKQAPGAWRAASGIELALGKDALHGWPAHLSARWLDDAFKALAPRGVDPGPLREPLGGATFLRAATAWGFAWRTAGTPRSMPFALARDPYPASAYRFGFTLGFVVAEPSFQRRVLDLAPRLAGAQARVLHTSMFLHARTVAARAVLASEETVSASLFEEITARVFGAPLPAALRNAWPEHDVSEPARLVGLLGTQAFTRNLVERYDEDWFRNPKAGLHLTSMACGPAFDDEPIPEGAPAALARAFEEALG